MAPASGKLDRSNTRAFGETHAAEISKIDSEHVDTTKGHPSPPLSSKEAVQSEVPAPLAIPASNASPPINPSALNNSPAPIPLSNTPVPVSIPSEAEAVSPMPTIAETGVPISAKAQDPGPVSGSLKDLRSPVTGPAEEEKRERILHSEGGSTSSGAQPIVYVSAEEEKRRLEREERERLLHGANAPSSSSKPEGEGPDGGPPPYQE